MKEMVRYGFILGLICAVASGLLAGVNSLTKARIIAQAQAEEEGGLKEVFPEAAHFEPVKAAEEVLYYKAHDKDGKFIGAAFKASAKGHSSTIEALAGMTKDGQITAIKIISQNETPGLGSRVSETEFTGQFKNKKAGDLSEVQAITGATISSTAVIEAVEKKVCQIQGLIKNER
jgi:electron transport complex protein RnfG